LLCESYEIILIHDTTVNDKHEVNEMKRMRDIRERIMATLDQRPGDTFSISAVAGAIGSNNKSTTAALSKLLKIGLITRPQKGLYSTKGRPTAAIVSSQPAKVRKSAKSAETVPAEALSIVTIDVLVEGDKTKINAAELVRKLQEDMTVLDAKVKGVHEADRKKLKIRLSLPDE